MQNRFNNVVHWIHDHTATFFEWVVGITAGLKVFYEVFKYGREWIKGRAETRHKINSLIDSYDTNINVIQTLVDGVARLEVGQKVNSSKLDDLWVANKKSEIVQKIIIENSGAGYWITNEKGDSIDISKKSEEITGRDASELLNKNWFNFVKDSYKQQVMADMEFAMKNRTDFRTHYEFLKPDGKYVHILATAQIVIIEDVLHGWVGQIKEI